MYVKFGIPTAGLNLRPHDPGEGGIVILWNANVHQWTQFSIPSLEHSSVKYLICFINSKFCTFNVYTGVSHEECNWGSCRIANKGWSSILGLTALYHKMSTCCKGLCRAWDLGEASWMSQAMETGWEGVGWILLAQGGACDRPVWLW